MKVHISSINGLPQGWLINHHALKRVQKKKNCIKFLQFFCITIQGQVIG